MHHQVNIILNTRNNVQTSYNVKLYKYTQARSTKHDLRGIKKSKISENVSLSVLSYTREYSSIHCVPAQT